VKDGGSNEGFVSLTGLLPQVLPHVMTRDVCLEEKARGFFLSFFLSSSRGVWRWELGQSLSFEAYSAGLSF